MRSADWGERSSRWAGIRSETVDVHGTGVHLLRAEAAPAAPVQLLVHPMASGGVFWLDVLRPLTAYGPVIVPDLPGAVFGHTASPHRHAARAAPSARFLRALTTTLGLERLVVHGWSFGGLVALLFADLEPGRVQRLVLTDPALPGPMSTTERVAWQTLGRLALSIGVPLASELVAVFGSALVGMKQRRSRQPLSAGRFGGAVGDLSRCSPELITLITEQLAELKSQPGRLRDGVIAFGSAISAMYVDRRLAQDAIDRLTVPTLLLWGDEDPLIERRTIDHLIAGRPGWALHVFEGVGHLPPWEVPDAYAQAVGRWLTARQEPAAGGTEA